MSLYYDSEKHQDGAPHAEDAMDGSPEAWDAMDGSPEGMADIWGDN